MIYLADSNIWRSKVQTYKHPMRATWIQTLQMRLRQNCIVRSQLQYWATDQELDMLIGWLSVASPDRRNAGKKEVARVLEKVLQRAEHAWAKRWEGVHKVFAKAVVRIRWLKSSNDVGYAKRGLLHVLRARVFLGLLEERMRYYLRALRCGVGRLLSRRQAQAVRRVLRTWCWRGRCEAGYYVLLCMLVRSC